MDQGLSRRAFLRALGASAALASGGCFEAPQEKILPYTRRPADVIPGRSRFYATTFELAGHGVGVLAESREGRPVKIEGNPEHPASLGAAGVLQQATLLDLYDPDRLRHVERRGQPTTWARFFERFGSARPAAPRPDLRFLLEPTASPLVSRLLDLVPERLPGARVHFHAPLHARTALDAAQALFGRPLQPLPRFDRAHVVLSLDDDFLAQGPFHLRHARHFAERRRIHERDGEMSRLYTVGPSPTPTTSLADHALRRAASRVRSFAAALLREVLARTGPADAELARLLEAEGGDPEAQVVRAVAEDLLRSPGEGLVVAGERQESAVHALAYAINARIGALGATLDFVPSFLRQAESPEQGIEALVDAMRAGEVGTLVILAGNPVYDAPVDLGFGDALRRVPESLAVSLLPDETTRRVTWAVPGLHPLEAWGDARALDGSASIVQPLISPLFGGRSPAEVLGAFLGEAGQTAYQRLRALWRAPGSQAQPEAWWEEVLRVGVVPGTRATPIGVRPDWRALARLLERHPPERSAPGAIELVFAADARIRDGRFANNPWLQELPDPVTKLTWDNAAWLSPNTARRLGVEDGQWIVLRHTGRSLAVPALAVAGQADDSIALALGYGREGPLAVAAGVGFDAYALRTSRTPYAARAEVAAAGAGEGREPYRLARTQHHWQLHDRAHQVVRHETLSEYRSARPEHGFAASLYSAQYDAPLQWGMAIDLSVCSGCSACVVACQAENNVPVVGKEGVLVSREMHWLRVDRYLTGPEHDPRPVSQPMLCQHCEMAPCEYVCPVNATVHSSDGLNEMVYNRCVGTRFCSNNCPYKVRRFNWFDYNANPPELHRMQKNPEVTVRARGVMEKCTYCVQRIRRVQHEARSEGRPVLDGEVVTACQQACPTRAIRFGDVSDPTSDVSRVLRAPQTFSVLEELGTRPRTRYLARIHNANPRLEERSGGKREG